nr:hypothetical protein [Thermus thalpophilus]
MLLALGLGLAACSGHTVTRLEVDWLSFVPEADRSGELNLTQTSLRVPEAPEGQLLSVPGAEALVDGRIVFAADLTNTGTLPAGVTLEVRMAPASDGNLYDGSGGDFLVAQRSVNLNPSEAGTLDLTLDVTPGTQVYDLIRSGNFRIGARINLTGDKVGYQLRQGELTLRLKAFNLIPAP